MLIVLTGTLLAAALYIGGFPGHVTPWGRRSLLVQVGESGEGGHCYGE